jgi:hypothetical protein
MQCILCKIYFWKVFHMNYNLICIFMRTPICTKFFILVKSGCYTLLHELWVTGEGLGRHGSGPLKEKQFHKFIYPFSIITDQ